MINDKNEIITWLDDFRLKWCQPANTNEVKQTRYHGSEEGNNWEKEM